MGARSAASRPFPAIRAPRRADGSRDARRLGSLTLAHGPALLAMLGLAWLAVSGPQLDLGPYGIAFATALPLWVTARAWRLPWPLVVAPALLPVSLGVVALVHGEPYGLAQSARLGYGVVLFTGAAAWAISPRRRLALGGALTGIALAVLVLSVAGWVAAGNPLGVMAGTLGWHNQTAIVLIAGYVLAASLAIGRAGAGIATVAAALLGAGAILTGSRFGVALLVASAAAILIAAAIRAVGTRDRPRTWWPLLRWVLGAAGAAVGALALRSPLFFPGTATAPNPVAGIVSRGTLESSWTSRWDFWQAAFGMGLDHPVAGAGLWSYARDGICYAEGPLMWHPHNEWLYAFAQGGLVAFVPLVFVLVGGGIWLAVRSLRSGPPRLLAEPVRLGALVAFGAGVAHLTTEYDLAYLALVGMLAVTAAIGVAPLVTRTSPAPHRSTASAVVAWTTLGVVLALSLVALLTDPRAVVYPWTGPVVQVCGAGF